MEKIVRDQLIEAVKGHKACVDNEDWFEAARLSARIEALEDVLTEFDHHKSLENNVVKIHG